MTPTLLFSLLACSPSAQRVALGPWDLTLEGGQLQVSHLAYGEVLTDARLAFGQGTDQAEMRLGSFLFEDDDAQRAEVASFGRVHGREVAPVLVDLLDADGHSVGTLTLSLTAGADLALEVVGDALTVNRTSLSAACDADDHFMGAGGHAMDVDHVGQAFPLWVSEPGIGKSTTEEQGEDWFARGTRHAASLPVPFLLRPHRAQGLLFDVPERVDLDLCATDPGRFSLQSWGRGARVVIFAEPGPVEVLQALTAQTGRPPLAPPWVFGPWNDAIRGADRVREVAATLRGAGAPSSVIWTEDWKGGEDTVYGYSLGGEWTADEAIYPDTAALADELEAAGFKWLAYFNTFLRSGTAVYDEAVEAGVVIRDADGAPYRFTGPAFVPETMLDLTEPAAWDFAAARMQAALDLGFDGWMADFAEWLPTDAVLASGEDPWEVHNLYPLLWQELNAELLADRDATFFVRSGWARTGGVVPVVWGGDQSTSFLPDDGLPSVVSMGVGLAASGVPVFTHDVAGYQTFGVGPSDKELWFRWAELGAFSPILRTHHGTEDLECWQFDRDAETLAHWTRLAREHTRLWPYRYGLARRASEEGVPMLLPVAFRYGDDWGRRDAWLLGDSLLVAPVLEGGARALQVDLPDQVRWYDWWTLEPATSGVFDAPLDHIPVFAAAGTTVPVFAEVPDTLVEVDDPEVLDLSAVDGARVVYLFGGGGEFVEGDGTSYRPQGLPEGPGEVEQTLSQGTVEVAGVSLAIDGPVTRRYRVVVVP
ncbi:MAG: hypothetical protein JXX28_16950 [Deltaproteobacteria bacterium]|nr:hypothetical protein [Deltaproteobacteria bacterium]